MNVKNTMVRMFVCAGVALGVSVGARGQMMFPIYDGGEGARDRAMLEQIERGVFQACHDAQRVIDQVQRNQRVMADLNVRYDNDLAQIRNGNVTNQMIQRWIAEATDWAKNNTKRRMAANGDGDVADLMARRATERARELWYHETGTMLNYASRPANGQHAILWDICQFIVRAYAS